MLAAHARKLHRARLRGLAPPACTNLPSLQLMSNVRKLDCGINTLTVSQHHLLHSLAALGFTDCRAPFFAGAKLPSRKASSHFSRPSASRAPNNVRQALSHTPSSSRCFSRRQHAAGDWILVRVKTATPPRFVDPTECLQSAPGLMPQGQVPSAPSPPVFAYRKRVNKTALPVCRQDNSEDESRRKLKLAWGIKGARQLAVRRSMTRRHCPPRGRSKLWPIH